MILAGLHRIYNFQHMDGGWGWWLDDESQILMTSIIISALIQIEKIGFSVNPISLGQGIDYLISHQNPNGFLDFNQYSSNYLEATAFILKALIRYNNITSQLDMALSKAVNSCIQLWNNNEDFHSSYAASLYYIATH